MPDGNNERVPEMTGRRGTYHEPERCARRRQYMGDSAEHEAPIQLAGFQRPMYDSPMTGYSRNSCASAGLPLHRADVIFCVAFSGGNEPLKNHQYPKVIKVLTGAMCMKNKSLSLLLHI